MIIIKLMNYRSFNRVRHRPFLFIANQQRSRFHSRNGDTALNLELFEAVLTGHSQKRVDFFLLIHQNGQDLILKVAFLKLVKEFVLHAVIDGRGVELNFLDIEKNIHNPFQSGLKDRVN